ncbi:MAG: BPSS1780 family membrane protein, partial [Caldimonas sp.]
MRLILASPREGLVWVRRAFQIFFRQPLGFASLFAACALVFFLLLRVPFVGEPILLIVAPVGSLLFMIAARLGAAGQRPVPGAFIELASTDRPRVIRMLKLGLAYLVAALLAVGLIAAVEGDAMTAFMNAAANPQASPEATATQLADPRLQAGFLLRLGLGALLSIPFWHAPALVYWGGQSWAKALFFSTVAIWRNKGAFAIYGLVWALLGACFVMLLGVVVNLIGPLTATYIATPAVLFFTTVLYVSLWFTFT